MDVSDDAQGTYLVIRPAQQVACASIEDGVCGRAWRGAPFGDLVCQVLDEDGVGCLVQGGEAVARKKDRTSSQATFALLQSEEAFIASSL